MNFSHNFSVVREASGPVLRIGAWRALKEHAVGKRYGVSVIWVGLSRMRALNSTYRAKPQATNVLAFPLTRNYGEIFLCVTRIRQEAAKSGIPPARHASALFIHALLHLKGMDHTRKQDRICMEHEEKRLLVWYNKRY